MDVPTAPAPLCPITQHKAAGMEQAAAPACGDASWCLSVQFGEGIAAMGVILGENSMFH